MKRLMLRMASSLFSILGKSAISDVNITIVGGGEPFFVAGQHTYINKATIYCWKSGQSLQIGSYCSMAEDICFLLGGEHDLSWVSTYPFIERWKVARLTDKVTKKTRGNINIGSDVWIGHGAIILSGSNIGVGSVIGAGAVVRGDIPPYSIAVGVPAKVIKRRFSDDICEQLLKSKWWTLEKDQLIGLVKYMDQPRKFVAAINDAHAKE